MFLIRQWWLNMFKTCRFVSSLVVCLAEIVPGSPDLGSYFVGVLFSKYKLWKQVWELSFKWLAITMPHANPCVHLSASTTTHPGALDLKASVVEQGEARVLSEQTGPILSPGDGGLGLPGRLTPEKGRTSQRLCLVGRALSDDRWRAVLQG